MPKPTPGPWEARAVDSISIGVLRVYAGSGLIATPGHRRDIEEEQANARLISAAPEMLKALMMVRDTLPHIGGSAMSVHSMLRDIDAAIAKAQSE